MRSAGSSSESWSGCRSRAPRSDERGRTSLMVVRSVDLSAGGVKVVTEHTLVPGNRVRVVFRVDDDTNARLDATVLRVEPLDDELYRYAIDFDPRRPLRRAAADADGLRGRAAERRAPQARAHDRLAGDALPDRGGRGVRRPRAPDLGRRRPDHQPQAAVRGRAAPRRRWRTASLGFGVETDAIVGSVHTDARGSCVATVTWDNLDRITRSAILRRSMEQERRDLAGD